MSLIGNERTKLLAGNLDRASTACLTLGILAPLAGLPYGVSVLKEAVPLPFVLVGIVCWLGGAVVLHLLARRVLAGLKG
jgi:hypothetical protein